MDLRTRLNDDDEMLETVADAVRAKIYMALPVKLAEDSEDGHTVKLQPTVKAVQKLPDGTQKLVQLPVLTDVPIQHASGGGVTVTFPHKKDDEGMVVFLSRSMDAWFQQGGIQPQVDRRMHSLSDGIYIPGVRSTPRKLKNVSKTSTQMRSDDGKHLFDLHPQTGPTMSADEGKHVVSVNPQSGISVKTAMKLALDATKGLDVKGATHFKDKVTSDKSIGAPVLSGILGGVAGFVLALACAAGLMAVHAPQGGVQTAVYTLAALWGY